jgi:serine/threonine-protein kinase
MKMAPAQWQTISSLLDEALALPPAHRAAWLDTREFPDATLRTLLRDLLDRPGGAETADLIGTLPALDRLPDAAQWAPGSIVGPYRLVREIGRGGMGAVWLAERADGLLKRSVALKLPIVAVARDVLAERFARERDILASLTHPNIARLYDAGFASDGQPYLALEYVDGEPLTHYCDRLRLPLRARIRLFLQVLAGVQHAHANLALHRDLKPSNILVTAQGDIKLLDFGIAKLMAEGRAQETALTQVAGRALTPDYAAPEQITGAALTTAADVYALGVVLYELCAGRRPYRLRRGTRSELEEAIVAQDVVRPSSAVSGDAAAQRGTSAHKLARALAGDLDTIVEKALRKAPSHRYASTEAFAADLARYLDGQPVLARPASRWYRARKFAQRNRLALLASGAVGAALIAGASVAVWQAHIARAEAARAHASQDFLVRLFQRTARNNPGGAAAADTTVRQLLDIGSRQLVDDAHDDPDLAFDLLQLLTRLNVELDLLDPAGRLSERAVALARERHGADSLPYAQALAQKADLLYRAAHYAEAIGAAEDALRIAERTPQSTAELRARAHVIIGNSQYQIDASQPAEAQRHLELALALLKDVHATSEDRSRAAYFLAWIAESQRDFARAEVYYRDGIDAGKANFGERSFIVAMGYEGMSDMFRVSQRLPEARAAIEQALSIYEYVLGPRHGTIAFARATLALTLAAGGQRAEAERLLDQSVALAQQVFGSEARQVAYPAGYAARVKANRGELDAAAQSYELALVVYAHESPSSLSNRAMRVEYAEVEIARGQFDRAAALLDESQRGFDAAHDDASVHRAWLTTARAELLCARGDRAAGQALFDQALAQMGSLKSRGAFLLPRYAAALARTHPDAAHAQRVLDRLREVGLLAGDAGAAKLDLEDQARLAYGAGVLETIVGDAEAARPSLARVVSLREGSDAPDSPWLGEARVALAQVQR